MKRLLAMLLAIILLASFSYAEFIDDGSNNQTAGYCGTLNTTNATYTLNQTIIANSTCLTIEANNITINLNGSTIIGNMTGIGIYSSDYSNLTIENGTLNNFSYGLSFSSSESTTTRNITVINCTTSIMLNGFSNNNIIKDITIYNSTLGINITHSTQTSIINNTFFNTIWAYLLYNTSITNYDLINASLEISNQYTTIKFLNTSLNAQGTNLSNVIQMSHNYIYLNSTMNINLNQSANITLNSINYVNPKILAKWSDNDNWTDCPSNICINTSYSENTYLFNVTHFTSYKLKEIDQSIYQCGILNVTNITYTLNNTLIANSTCLTIEANNIILNLNGSTIYTNLTSGYGITTSGYSNITIANGTIINFSRAILFGDSSNNIIQNIIINASDDYGVYLNNLSSSTVSDITITKSGAYGLYLLSSSGNSINKITTNNITGLFCGNGLRVKYSSNTTISNSTVRNVNKNSLCIGSYSEQNINMTYFNITYINNYYGSKHTGEHNSTITYSNYINSTGYGLYITSSSGETVSDASLTNSTLEVISTTNSTLQNLTFTDCGNYCIYSSLSNNITILNNIFSASTITTNITINLTTNSTINSTTIFTGLNITNSHDLFIYNNTFHNNSISIYLLNSSMRKYTLINSSLRIATRTVTLDYHNRSFSHSGENTSNIFSFTTNSITVNSSSDPKFNQSANITIADISFNPFILYSAGDTNVYEECPSSICSKTSYTNNALRFNVTHFTTYKAGKIPIYSCQTLNVSNKLYYLNRSHNITSTCFNITASNISIDMRSHYINSTNQTTAIKIYNATNITLYNGTIKKQNISIHFQNTSDISISDLNIYNSEFAFFFLNRSSANIIFSNIYNTTIAAHSFNNSGTATLQHNYWGYSEAANITPLFNGTVSYNPWLTVDHPDATAPNITISSPSGSTWTASRQVNFSIISDDLVSVKYRSNQTNGSWSSWTQCYTTSNNGGDGYCDGISFSTNKTVVFEINATNLYNLSTKTNKTVKIDYEDPAPDLGQFITGSGGNLASNTVILSHLWPAAQGETNMTIDKDEFSITYIEFFLNYIARNAKLTVKKLGMHPNVLQNMTHEVYNYFEFTRENMISSNMSNIEIKFKIEKTWFVSRSQYNIKMYRYNSGWEELYTRYLTSDATYYYFKAQTPGFSYFAIAHINYSTPAITTTTIPVAGVTTTSTTVVDASSTTIWQQTSTTLEEDDRTEFNYLLPFFIILIIVIIVGLVTLIILFRDNLLALIPKIKEIFFKILSYIPNAPKQIHIMHDDEFEFDDLLAYVLSCKEQGFTKIEIRDQLESERVPKKVINKALKQL